ncbi:MAG: hypothetical protein ACTSRK_19530 [Promethearchaeota archaeon]
MSNEPPSRNTVGLYAYTNNTNRELYIYRYQALSEIQKDSEVLKNLCRSKNTQIMP